MRIQSSAAMLVAASAAVATTVLFASAASADISFVNMFRSDSYTQTANGNSLTSNGSFLSFDLNSTTANEYASALVTFPGPASPVTLLPTSTPTILSYQTGSYPTRAAMDADFPTGTYVFTATPPATRGVPVNTTRFDYTTDAYPTVPYLTGTDYAALQGMNATAPFTAHVSTFTPDAATSEGLMFFTVFDETTTTRVFEVDFLPPSTTSVTIPANTLTAGHDYQYEIVFSDRVFAPSPGAQFDAQLGFDARTSGLFTATAPEPTTLLAGAALLMAMGRRAKAR